VELVQAGLHCAGKPENRLRMISKGGEQCGGVTDFLGREQEQVTARSFGNPELRWIEACAAWPPGARVRRLLLCTNQRVDGEGGGCNQPARDARRPHYLTHTKAKEPRLTPNTY
jgi:hypothetical protein